MSSVQRSYAQRNTNVVEVVPTLATSGYWNGYYLLNIDPRYGSVFNVTLDASTQGYPITFTEGNCRLNNRGQIPTGPQTVPVVYFVNIVDPKVAALYPGLEYTINFTWTEVISTQTCIDIYPNATLTSYYDYDMLSPVGGYASFYTQSITLKSDGKNFNVIASGPSSWSSEYDA